MPLSQAQKFLGMCSSLHNSPGLLIERNILPPDMIKSQTLLICTKQEADYLRILTRVYSLTLTPQIVTVVLKTF